MVSANPFVAPAHVEPAPRRLIIASTRGPVEHYVTDAGSIRRRDAGGGVAVALRGVAERAAVTWVAAACGFADQIVARTGRKVPIGRESDLRLLPLPDTAYEPYYRVFCNPLLWFAQHSLSSDLHQSHSGPEAIRAWRDGYVAVNRAFAEAIVEEIDEAGGETDVMLHDYHLYLVARMLRQRRSVAIQQFIHIPWPSPEQWNVLPGPLVREICRGLLGNDSVVFQDDTSVENFKDTCLAYLGDEVQVASSSPYVGHSEGETFVWCNPISVDAARLKALAATDDMKRCRAELDEPGLQTILRVDRLDPSKNVLRGFEAFDLMLRMQPELRGRVRFLACLVPSRSGIPEYDDYAAATFNMVRSINERYGTASWSPISVLYEQNRDQALAALSLYDVLLVNSVADGMNLVSKEGPVLNTRDGMLVLSETAGSHSELKHAAFSVNPLDVEATAASLAAALQLPLSERQERSEKLRRAVESYQLSDWLRAQIKDLELIAYGKLIASAT